MSSTYSVLPHDLVSVEVAAEQVGAHPQTSFTTCTFPVLYPVLAPERGPRWQIHAQRRNLRISVDERRRKATKRAIQISLLPESGWPHRIPGKAFATVGISQLTTSRRLGSQALVAAETEPGTFQLDGAMPWVTAAERADVLVTGALLDDGRQMLIALPVDRPGLTVRPAFELAALQASCTTEVILEKVRVSAADLLAGPSADLSAQPGAVGTAGLETSALALGQARAALGALAGLAADRLELSDPVDVLCETWQQTWTSLVACARGERDAVAASQIRAQANALVLRATQAYLTARKGSGFLRTEPAQRWARQALFFLVWSCPTPIAQAAIRDFAGLCPA